MMISIDDTFIKFSIGWECSKSMLSAWQIVQQFLPPSYDVCFYYATQNPKSQRKERGKKSHTEGMRWECSQMFKCHTCCTNKKESFMCRNLTPQQPYTLEERYPITKNMLHWRQRHTKSTTKKKFSMMLSRKRQRGGKMA